VGAAARGGSTAVHPGGAVGGCVSAASELAGSCGVAVFAVVFGSCDRSDLTMSYLLTEVADRERQANQARTMSLGTWAASMALVFLCLTPAGRSPLNKVLLLLSASSLTVVSRLTANNLATHDRILQDFRDISDNQRQQLVYEMLSPKALMKPAVEAEALALPEALPRHNISRVIASQLKSTVVLGAPRSGKGYAIAHAIAQLPANIDLWLIDPKDDPNESHYWHRIPESQRIRFDVTTLPPNQVNQLVTNLFNRYLEAESSAERPKLLIVDECAPGLAKGMTGKAYRAFMGRLSTICSVGPSKGKFVWIMAQASTVDDLAMSNGNKASFRLVAVGHAQQTEGSWYRSLKRSMGIETPAPALTGYIQMLDGQWGYAEPFEVTYQNREPEDSDRAADEVIPLEGTAIAPSFNQRSQAVLSYFECRNREPVSLRQLTQANFARREGLTSQRAMMTALSPLLDAEKIEETEAGDYQMSEPML
jgi:hypothetical protein